MTVQTAFKALAGTEVDLVVKCTSVESGDIATNEFKIVFRDECLDATVNWVTRADNEVPIYFFDFAEIANPTVDTANCGSIGVQIESVSVVSGATTPTGFALQNIDQTLFVRSYPVLAANVGVYEITLKACITIASTSTQVCTTIDYQTTVVNPCATTTLSGGDFSDIMQATILGSDFRVDDFSGTHAVAQNSPLSTGPQSLCGPITVEVQDTDGNAVDLVNVNAAKTQINLVPDLGDLPAPRTVDLQLVYKLANFPTATPYIDPFQVELLECVPALDGNAVVAALVD